MFKSSTGAAYIFVPVKPPVDPTGFTVSIALIPAATGGEPLVTDYKPASWSGTFAAGNLEAALLLTEGLYPDGEYAVWVRIQASPEDLRIPSGRCRIGDTRT